MSNPYSEITFTGYNSNPPPDNGSETGANQVKWATIKSKLADPVKAAVASMNTNVKNAFATMFGVAPLVTSGSDLGMTTEHRGQTIVFTGSNNRTLTLVDATQAGAGFVVCVRNGSTGTLTIEAAEATPTQYVNGAGSIALGPGDGGLLVCDGSKFDYVGNTKDVVRFQTGTAQLFFNTSAPTGWVKDTSLDDAAIKLVSGTVGADAGSAAFSAVFKPLILEAANIPKLTGTALEAGLHHHTYTRYGNRGPGAGSGANWWYNNSDQNTSEAGAHTHIVEVGTIEPEALNFDVKFAKAIRARKA